MKKLFYLLPIIFLVGCSSTKGGSSNSPTPSYIPIEIEETETCLKEDMTFYKESQKICGELYIPDNSYDEYPLVILSHGFGSNMDSVRNLAKDICKIGCATFIYDFIGGGTNIKSDGKMTEMSVLTEAADLNVVIDELKDDERINQDNIFLLGQSQGGFVSTYVASNRDDIKGLIDYYPAFCIRDDAEKQYDSVDKVPDTYNVLGFATVGKIYYIDAVSFDIYEEMAKYENNVLLMHGTSDNVVPISYSERASKTMQHCEYIVYQGQGHGFSGDAEKDSTQRTINFLKDNLN